MNAKFTQKVFCLFFLLKTLCFTAQTNVALHNYNELPGQFVKVNNKLFFNSTSISNNFVDTCYVYGLYGNNVLFKNKLVKNEATAINDMIVTADKSIVYVGTAHGCDTPFNPTLFISKMDTMGNYLFDTNLSSYTWNGLKKIIEYTDSSFFAVTDSTLYHFSKNGNFISKKSTPVKSIMALCLKNNHLVLSSNYSTNLLTEIDTACNLINQTSPGYSFTKLNYIGNNCIIGLSSAGIVYKINNGLTILANSQSAQGNYKLTDFSLGNDTIYCSAYNVSNQFSVFKTDTTFANFSSISSNYISTIPAKIISDKSSLFFLNIEDSLSHHNPNISVLEMNKATSTMNITKDAGVINTVLDSAYLTRYLVNAGGGLIIAYNTYHYKLKVTVKNFGTDTLHGCYINHKPYLQLNCGISYYTQYFSGINLAPGQSTILTTTFIISEDGGNPNSAPSSNYTVTLNDICFWTSAPDRQSDANHANDSYCTSISFLAIVGIEEFAKRQTSVSGYPNPFSESFEISADNNFISGIEVCTIDGKLVKQLNQLNVQKTTLHLSELSNGFYLIKVLLKDGKYQIIKMVKN